MKVFEVNLDAQSLTISKNKISKRLTSIGVAKSSISETIVLFEELFMEAIRQNGDEKKVAKIVVANRFGAVHVKLQYEGKRFNTNGSQEELSASIINGFRDKLFIDYRRGLNTIVINVQNSKRESLVKYAALFVLAVITDMVISSFGLSARETAYNSIIFPIEKVLLNAIILISTPMAFFCLVKNIMKMITVSRRKTSSVRIALNVVIQSVEAIAICIIVSLLLHNTVFNVYDNYQGIEIANLSNLDVAKIVDFFFPSSLSDFFELSKPFAFISLAIITSVAICNSESHFDDLQRAIDSISTMLSKMLNIVLAIMPVAYFAAVLDDILFDPISDHILSYLLLFGYVMIPFVVLLAVSCIRIKLIGGKPFEFIKKSFPAIKENFSIGSTIDAVPYNVRFFSQTFNMSVKQLNDNLPFYAEVSQVGNCLCYSIISLTFMRFCSIPLNLLNLSIITMMSFFLGIGAPGQPGSILTGTIIINSFLGFPIEGMISSYIIFEVLLGSIASFANTWGDLVTMYTQKLKQSKNSSTNTK